jgi:hypothetical protein
LPLSREHPTLQLVRTTEESNHASATESWTVHPRSFTIIALERKGADRQEEKKISKEEVRS